MARARTASDAMTDAQHTPSARRAAIFIVATGMLLLSACTPPAASRSEPQPSQDTARSAVIAFGVIGDLPYSRGDERHVPDILLDMHRVGSRFALHVGDLKGSVEPCSEALLARRLNLLQTGPLPLIFTPGDNEWTDCHRLSAGGYEPLDRLTLLRKLAWPERSDGSQGRPFLAATDRTRGTLATEHQPGYPENARWRLEGLHFVTLHVVGSRNGLGQFPGSDAEMATRMKANAQWLDQTLALALRERAQGLVIAFHADPDFGTPPGQGYQTFQTLLQDAAQRFKGPILLVHGDGHRFRVDQPLPGPQGHWPQVTRLEAFGWPRSRHWALVTFESGRSPAFKIMAREAESDRRF